MQLCRGRACDVDRSPSPRDWMDGADVRRLSRRENTMNLAIVKRHSEKHDRFGQHDRLVKVLNPET